MDNYSKRPQSKKTKPQNTISHQKPKSQDLKILGNSQIFDQDPGTMSPGPLGHGLKGHWAQVPGPIGPGPLGPKSLGPCAKHQTRQKTNKNQLVENKKTAFFLFWVFFQFMFVCSNSHFFDLLRSLISHVVLFLFFYLIRALGPWAVGSRAPRSWALGPKVLGPMGPWPLSPHS